MNGIFTRKITPRALILYVTLVLLALLGSNFVLDFNFGVQFFLCSAFLLIIARVHGVLWATLATITVSLVNYFVLDSQITTLWMNLEIVIIGLIVSQKKHALIIWDSLFWLIIAAPITGLLFFYQTGAFGTEGYLQVVMLVLNGIINALVAELIISYSPLSASRDQVKRLTVSQIFLHICMPVVIIPALIFLYLNSTEVRQNDEQKTALKLEAKTQQIMTQYRTAGNSASAVDQEKLVDLFNQIQTDSAIHFAAYDKDGGLLVSKGANFFSPTLTLLNQSTTKLNPFSDEAIETQSMAETQLFRWLPPKENYTYTTQLWQDGYYLLQTKSSPEMGFDLVAATSLTSSQTPILNSLLLQLSIILASCLVTILLAVIGAASVMGAVYELTRITTDLPARLKRFRMVRWPETIVFEVKSLIVNVHTMADRIAEMFQDMKEMNETLLENREDLENSEKKLLKLAYYDSLTHLPNRHFFMEQIETILNESIQKKRPCALVYVGIDQLKSINSYLGHDMGDLLLVEVGKRLITLAEEEETTQDICARIGGDIFGVLLKEVDKQGAILQAERMAQEITAPYLIGDQVIYVTASFGVALYPEHSRNRHQLWKHAELAMYAAKSEGGNGVKIYDAIMDRQLVEQTTIESYLREAFEQNELELAYQPVVNEKGDVIATEVFICYHEMNQNGQMVQRNLTLSQLKGQLHQVIQWVIIEACEQQQRWIAAELPHVTMKISVSMHQLINSQFVQTLLTIFEETPHQAQYLVTEIVDMASGKETRQVVTVLKQLTQLGMRIVIGNAGDGFTAIRQFRGLPIQALCLDESFVHGLPQDQVNVAFVKAMCQWGHSLRMPIAARGIKNESEFMFLQRLGCHQFQGEWISSPLNATIFIEKFNKLALDEVASSEERK